MKTEEVIVQMMENVAKSASKSREPRMIFGIVTGVNPLTVRIGEGDDAYEIDEDFMIIGELCRRRVLKIPLNDTFKHKHDCEDALGFSISGTAGTAGPVIFTVSPKGTTPAPPPGPNVDFTHKHEIAPALPEILLHRGVKKDDKVIILRLEGGSIHYVIERVGGSCNDGNSLNNDGTIKNNNEEQL